jgi:SAM-dependent methyltransferase
MSGALRSLEPAYFERLYALHSDPWHFADSAYERAKYEATLAALPRERYEAALELGCSIGVYTRRLGERCHNVLAIDVAEQALERARERCRDQLHVRFALHHLPHDFPHGSFDLILLSEVGYYFDRDDLRLLVERILGALTGDGHLLLVHWRPYVADYPLTGDQVHEEVLRLTEGTLRPLWHNLSYLYRLDLLGRS